MTLLEAITELSAGRIDGILTPSAAANMISKIGGNGQVFAVDFYKKGDKKGVGRNEHRTMRCRLGSTVKRGLVGGPPAYNPDDHDLIWAYLMAGDENRDGDDKNRRSISVKGLTRLVIDGKTYHVTGRKHRK